MANVPEAVPAGLATCLEGPYVNPSGGSLFYDVSDTYGDAMDIAVVADGNSCDPATGYLVTSSSDWQGRQSARSGPLPAGRYDLAIACYNVTYDCTPFLEDFGYQD